MSQSLNQLRKFVSPEIIFGAGSRHSVGNYAKTFGENKNRYTTSTACVRFNTRGVPAVAGGSAVLD